MKGLAFVLVLAVALVLAAGAAPATHFTVRPVAQTTKTITLEWKRQPGADGYAFLRNGVVVARTLSPSTTRATFWKGSRYGVVVLRVDDGRVRRGATASFVQKASAGRARPRLVFVPARSPAFALRLVGKTASTVTFGWKAQPGADGYRFIRDGAVVARTMNRSTTTATFWKGSRYAVDILRAAGKVLVPFRRAVVLASPGAKTTASGLVFRPAPRIDFRLRLVRQTKKTVTFTWKRQPGVDGYRFVRNGKTVAQTFKRSTSKATFWKGSRYAVVALRRGPGKRVTPIMQALAYTPGAAKKAGNGATQSPGTGSQTSPGSGTGSSPKPPTASPAPKPPSAAPKPPSQTPTPPPSNQPPAPPAVGPGGTVTLSGSYSPSAFLQALSVAPPGPVTMRGSYTINGDVSIDRPNVRIEGATVDGTIDFRSGSAGSSFVNGQATAFNIRGADDITLQGSTFDGKCRVAQNWIEDDPAGVVPERFKILNNTFRNYHICSNESAHSEALFVGYSNGGLIDGNTFVDNGTTGHIFFSWYGGIADPNVSWPRNICVENNTFIRSLNGYYHIQVRSEIPDSSNIDIDPSNVKGESIPGYNTSLTSRFARPC
jgi:hypothetical protein